MQIGRLIKTIRIAACRQNINRLGTKIVNNLPGVFRDVKRFFEMCRGNGKLHFFIAVRVRQPRRTAMGFRGEADGRGGTDSFTKAKPTIMEPAPRPTRMTRQMFRWRNTVISSLRSVAGGCFSDPWIAPGG